MNPLRQKYGDWALIAGAAEGVGEGFSTILAGYGFNIIMIDNNPDALKALAAKIREQFAVKIKTLTLDLNDQDAALKCLDLAAEMDARLLVYVAAFSRVQPFLTLDYADLDSFVHVNCRTLIHLVHEFASRLVQQKAPGGILLISSFAGLIAPQYVAAYAATKSFIIRLTEGLHPEFQQHHIDIMATPLGVVSTPAYLKSKPDGDKGAPYAMMPLFVATRTLEKLGRRVIYIPGLLNRLQFFIVLNLMPRSIARKLVNSTMRRMYGNL